MSGGGKEVFINFERDQDPDAIQKFSPQKVEKESEEAGRSAVTLRQSYGYVGSDERRAFM